MCNFKLTKQPVPISNRMCADCQVSAVCKYKDTMEEVRDKLVALTTRDAEGKAEIDLGVCFDMYLGCTHYRPNVNIQTIPEVDPYPLFKECGKGEYRCSDRTTPVDLT